MSVTRIVEDKRATSISEYLKVVEEYYAKGDLGRLWFRGVSKSSHQLLPTVFRHPTNTLEQLQKIGDELTDRFRERALPFTSANNLEGWDRLFLMQHFGAPTRLLDWSESALVALYFATQSINDQDAAVWVLSPGTWNKAIIPNTLGEGRPFATGDQSVMPYLKSDLAIKPEKPVAIYGNHNSARIVAQRGTFMVFSPWSKKAMENVFVDESSIPAHCLRRVIVPKANSESILKSLKSIGITESTVFPDLEGLARELRGEYGL